MARPVYSTRLFRAAAFAGPPVVFLTAPVGFVTVVKAISISVGTTAGTAHAWVEDDEGGKLAQLHESTAGLTDPLTLVFFGEWVFEPGETLSPATSVPTIADFHVAGYLLVAP